MPSHGILRGTLTLSADPAGSAGHLIFWLSCDQLLQLLLLSLYFLTPSADKDPSFIWPSTSEISYNTYQKTFDKSFGIKGGNSNVEKREEKPIEQDTENDYF